MNNGRHFLDCIESYHWVTHYLSVKNVSNHFGIKCNMPAIKVHKFKTSWNLAQYILHTEINKVLPMYQRILLTMHWNCFSSTSLSLFILADYWTIYYYTTITTSIKRPFSRTTWESRHQKGKPLWILIKQEMMGGWQRHQLDHMQIIAPPSRQITMPVPHHSVFT